jgi:hypothetical protein
MMSSAEIWFLVNRHRQLVSAIAACVSYFNGSLYSARRPPVKGSRVSKKPVKAEAEAELIASASSRKNLQTKPTERN